MINYKYSVLDRNNNIVNGKTKAMNATEVKDTLITEGYKVIKIQQEGFSISNTAFGTSKKLNTEETALFCKQMAIITKSGISVMKGLIMIRSQSDSPKIKNFCETLYTNIQKGYSISEAFENCGYRLPLILINMIKIGELTGNMDDIFQKMTDYFNKESATKKKIINAMIYPIILIVLSVAIVIFMILVILPQMAGVVEESGGKLPGFTQYMLDASKYIKTNYQFIGLGILIFVGILKWGIPTKYKIVVKNYIIFHGPLISSLTRDYVTARFVRTMGILVKTGLPLLTVLETLEHAIGIDAISKKIRETKDRVNKGESLTSSIEHMEYFDNMVTNIISIGEETGNLDETLLTLADYYDEKFDDSITRAISLIEPAFTIGMGVVIGGIAMSVMIPMFSMMGSLSGNS